MNLSLSTRSQFIKVLQNLNVRFCNTVFMAVFLLIVFHDDISAETVGLSDGQPDSLSYSLEEVSVTAKVPIKIIPRDKVLSISGVTLKNIPGLMGNPDPMRFLQTLSDVRTGSEVSPGISVQGLDYSHNSFSINGGKVINPYHMLGLFSAFNTSHFPTFNFTVVPFAVSDPNALGSIFDATNMLRSYDRVNGMASVGLINASATLNVPFGRDLRHSLSASFRQSYLDKVFPDILKFDHAGLLYRFSDVNVSYKYSFNSSAMLLADFFYSADHLKVDDGYYDMNGLFEWDNILGNVYLKTDRMNHRISYSRFANKLDMRESTFEMSLPSDLSEITYSGNFIFDRFMSGIECVYRNAVPQHSDRSDDNKESQGYELSAYGDYNFLYGDVFKINLGFRGTFYKENKFSKFYPMPKISVDFHFSNLFNLNLFAGRAVQFSHLVKESDTGLPANFWINASERFKPQSSWIYSAQLSGMLNGGIWQYKISGYYRSLFNSAEFDGSILNMVNSAYNPLDDLYQGNGRSYGLGLTVSCNLGAFQSWLSYNLGRSEIRIPQIASGYFPTNYDRRHDVNLTMAYSLNNKFHFSIAAAYATGTPYTQAAYGYMVGENLICQYYPHNSSRLPDYFRTDFAIGWDFAASRGCRHRLDLSIYNVTGHNNVLMRFYHYSPVNGLVFKDTSFKSVIPSVSYTISF